MAEWGEAGGSLTHVSDLEPSDLVLITLIPPCRLGAAFPQQAGHFKIFQIHQRCSRTKNHPTIYQPIFPDNLQNLNCSQTTCFPKSTTIPCWIRFRYLHLEDHSVDYRINQWFFHLSYVHQFRFVGWSNHVISKYETWQLNIDLYKWFSHHLDIPSYSAISNPRVILNSAQLQGRRQGRGRPGSQRFQALGTALVPAGRALPPGHAASLSKACHALRSTAIGMGDGNHPFYRDEWLEWP